MNESIKDILGDFVDSTVRDLVDLPDEVFVDVVISTKNITIQVKLDKSDCGKIIGKKGRTINALNVLALAIKNTKFPSDIRRVSVEVLEDENSQFNYKRN